MPERSKEENGAVVPTVAKVRLSFLLSEELDEVELFVPQAAKSNVEATNKLLIPRIFLNFINNSSLILVYILTFF